ncbi:fibronectin type III domain-containing protein [Pseudomonadales bacterium]|nr:fibronectin type III domain-containing protein [Pseudomonadales bacterium]
MNKLLVGTLLAFTCLSSFADDLNVADDFKSGDLVSADTFNQIFDTIEKINRTVVDSDLVGVWSCDAMTTRNTTGWTSKSLFYILENSQVNLTASSSATSLESAYTISTSSPSPFKRTLASAFSGTYILYNNKLFTKQADESEARIWDVNIISPTRFELTFLETSAQSFPTNYASFITCDSAEAVPASPTAPTATNNKTGINLAWTDASSDETGFKVYRKLSTETEAKVIATQTAVTYSDTDLTEGQTAYYHVTAYNDNGDSAKSKTVSATTDFTPPTVLSVTPAADLSHNGFITLSVSVIFSESMLIKSGSASEVPLITYKLDGVSYNADISVMTISSGTVSGILINHQASSSYEMTIRKEDITDSTGLSMDSDYVWVFTTQ